METNQMKVKIDDLEKVLILLFAQLRENVGDILEINNDFYWDIPAEDLYNAYEEPKKLTLGQLSDDLNEIKRLIASPDEAISYDLKRISNIIKSLSNENPIAF